MEAQNLFANSRKNITVNISVIRSTEYHGKYVKDLIKDWENQLIILPIIAETQPQAAHSAFFSGLNSKLNYFLITNPHIHHLLLPLGRRIRNN